MNARRILAFDLGGTRIKMGIVDVVSAVVEHRRIEPTPPGADAALRALVRMGRESADADRIDGVGLCVPGLVDESGRIVALPGKLDGIVGVDLLSRLNSEFGLPAVVVNDAIACGLGEVRFGAGRGYDRVVVVTIGTGVGVAVFERGVQLGRGTLGGGLLGGQIPVFEDRDGPVDSNGRHGTIEARCAAVQILAAARACGSEASEVREVYAGAAAGNVADQAGIAAYRSDLARALVALAHAHAPACLVLGGGPMSPGNPCAGGLEDLVNAELWPGYHVAVRIAEQGDDAALLGVADRAAEMR